MKIIFNLFVNSLAVFIASYLIAGVNVTGITSIVVTVVVLGVLNTFLKPIVKIITLPINILTLGLFSIIINTGIILLTAYLVEGFSITSFFTALIFSITLSLISSFLSILKN